MKMPDFIENNLEAILQEWDDVAERQLPAAAGMTRQELRDLAGVILRAVAEDMKIGQSEEERHEKSRGGRPVDQPPDVIDSARAHAAERLSSGFNNSTARC